MNDNYIKLPNNIVWCYKEGELPLCREDNKLLLTTTHLNFSVNFTGLCCFTLNDMITSCGLVPKRGSGNTIEQFKVALKQLQIMKWLDSEIDFDYIKGNQFIKCNFKPTFIQSEEDKDTEFFKLYHDKYYKIMNNDSELDKAITLKIFCYITARIRRNDDIDKESREIHNLTDTHVECFYDDYITICKDLNVSDVTYNAHIDLLEELELIYHDNIGLVKQSKFPPYNASNVYAETKEYLKMGLTCSKKHYVDKGCEIIGKKVSDKKKKAIGHKGKVKQVENKKIRENIIEEIGKCVTELSSLCSMEAIEKAIGNRKFKTSNIKELKQIKIDLENLKEEYEELPY